VLQQLLSSAEDDLNALDGKSGDGDTELNAGRALRARVTAMDSLAARGFTRNLSRQLVKGAKQTIGRLLGVLLAIFFAACRGMAASAGMPMRQALYLAGAGSGMQEIGRGQAWRRSH